MITLIIRLRRTAIAVAFATMTIIASQPALAIVPEIEVDPRTGKAVSHHDLEVALVALSDLVMHAESRWQRAPWFAT